MGGMGSGRHFRWDAKPALDELRALDINRMVKLGAVKDGVFESGSWKWMDSRTNEVKSIISYQCYTVNPNHSYLKLTYVMTESKKRMEYEVPLVRTTPPYGGVRFWFLCPATGKRVSKLFLSPDSSRFLSRHAFRLYYESQMKGKIDRAINKKWKLLRKLRHGLDYPIRPKGMHEKTYRRIYDAFQEQDYLCDRMIFERLRLL